MDLESGSFPTVPVVPVVIPFLYLFVFVPDDQLMITEAWKCNTNSYILIYQNDILNLSSRHKTCWHVFRYQSRTCYSMSKISSKWAVSRRPVWADVLLKEQLNITSISLVGCGRVLRLASVGKKRQVWASEILGSSQRYTRSSHIINPPLTCVTLFLGVIVSHINSF